MQSKELLKFLLSYNEELLTMVCPFGALPLPSTVMTFDSSQEYIKLEFSLNILNDILKNVTCNVYSAE